MDHPPEPLFLTAASGQRFCIYHPPQTVAVRGSVLYLPPFAEEMNKSRRMAALQSRDLAAHGFAVLQIDPLGCGDSSGDFGDATWQAWVEDACLGAAWLRARHDAPLWLWGLRAGCLLASAAAKVIPAPCNFLFWQPATAGKTLLQQFLRLKVAGELLSGDSKGVMEQLRQQLADRIPVEIAGYQLNPALADGLNQVELNAPDTSARLVWLEVSARADLTLAPVSVQRLAQWEKAGFRNHAAAVPGPAFWQTAEIETAPALISATTRAVLSGEPT